MAFVSDTVSSPTPFLPQDCKCDCKEITIRFETNGKDAKEIMEKLGERTSHKKTEKCKKNAKN